MHRISNLIIEWIRQLPQWGKAFGGLAGTILTLVSVYGVYQTNFPAFILVVVPVIVLTIIFVGIYLILVRTAPQIIGGRGFPVFSPLTRFTAGLVIIGTLISSSVYYVSDQGRAELKKAWNGTSTPTPTNTLLPTLTPTLTLTQTLIPTATPDEQGIFYMFVLDASVTMMESFEAQSKWDAALRAVDSILVGLEDGANYGLVAIGGAPGIGSSNPCEEPSLLAVPFSTNKVDVGGKVGQLQPGGGGSLYKAFVLAVDELDRLPDSTVRSLIYITGSEDACESQDEWADLERFFKIRGDARLDIYSEIIILDDKKGFQTQTIADRLSALSDKVNAQAPQTIFQVLQSKDTVINNISIYVDTVIASILADTPTDTPTMTLSPTNTATLRPGQTPPTSLPTNTPSFTPTNTPTLTRTVTPSLTLSPHPVCQPTSSYLDTYSFGGSAWINSPSDCTSGITSGAAIPASGGYSGLPDGTILWVFVYPPNGPYYPQSPDACAASPSPYPAQGGGGWGVPAYFGNTGDSSRSFDLVVMVTDQAGSDYIGQRLYEDCLNGFYDGISAGELAQLNITQKAFITVQTQ
jgi:hypothetical protein